MSLLESYRIVHRNKEKIKIFNFNLKGQEPDQHCETTRNYWALFLGCHHQDELIPIIFLFFCHFICVRIRADMLVETVPRRSRKSREHSDVESLLGHWLWLLAGRKWRWFCVPPSHCQSANYLLFTQIRSCPSPQTSSKQSFPSIYHTSPHLASSWIDGISCLSPSHPS